MAGPDDPGALVFRPRRLRVLTAVMSAALCVLVVVGWYALPLTLRELFTLSQRLTLLGVLAVLVLGMAILSVSSVRADDEGLRLRNGLRTHAVGWDRVHKILLRPGDPWAIVLLVPADGRPFEVDLDAEKCQLLGIQANDGAAARQAVQALRERRQRALRSR